MAFLYIILGYQNMKNTKNCIKSLFRVTRDALAANPNDVMAQSFKIKMS